MTTLQLQGAPVLVVGAGIMGAGIAQVAAQAGHAVQLFDARDGAAGNHREGDHGFEAGGEEGIDGEVTVLLGNMILTPDRPGSTAFGMF